MKNLSLGLFLVAISFLSVAESNTATEGQSISFVACPVVRDTKTVPCWLAEYEGQRYYLGIQQDIGAAWYPPQLKHQVLVEGRVTNQKVCGGIVIEAIKTSVLPELDLRCNTILPADERFAAPHAERGAGPKNEAPGSSPRRARPSKPKPPFTEMTFEVYFDFDNEQIVSREFNAIRQAIAYAKASQAKLIKVTSHRGSVSLSNGEVLVELPGLIQKRAKAVHEWLKLGDLSAKTKLKINALHEAESSDGEEDWQTRRVSIRVIP